MAKRALSLQSNGLSVTYHSKNWTNRLSADYLTLEDSEGGITLAMDMVSNQESPDEDTRHDIAEFVEDIKDIDFIQIHEKDSVQGIQDVLTESPKIKWTLVMRFHNEEIHSLAVKPEIENGSAFLRVQKG